MSDTICSCCGENNYLEFVKSCKTEDCPNTVCARCCLVQCEVMDREEADMLDEDGLERLDMDTDNDIDGICPACQAGLVPDKKLFEHALELLGMDRKQLSELYKVANELKRE